MIWKRKSWLSVKGPLRRYALLPVLVDNEYWAWLEWYWLIKEWDHDGVYRIRRFSQSAADMEVAKLKMEYRHGGEA